MKLLKKKLTKPTEANINAIKVYNNMYNKQKRTLKINYFNKALEENACKLNSKKCWSLICTNLHSLKLLKLIIKIFLLQNIFLKDLQFVLQNWYSNQSKCSTYKQRLPVIHAKLTTTQHIPQSCATRRHYFNYNKLKTSTGHDGVSTKFLKAIINNIIQPITHLL